MVSIPEGFGEFLNSNEIELDGNLDPDEFPIDVVANMSKDNLIQNFQLDKNLASEIHKTLAKKRKIPRKDSCPKSVKKFFSGLFKTGHEIQIPPKFVDFFKDPDLKLENHWLKMDFITAAYSGGTEIVLSTFNTGTKDARKRMVNERTDEGWTPLMYAAMLGRTNICRFLLENDANMKTRNSDGQTALMIASSFGHAEIIKTMVEFGKNKANLFKNRNPEDVLKDEILLNLTDKNGQTALHFASIFDQAIALKLLLGLGANPNIPDKQGMTPTLYSCEYIVKNKECLAELIKSGGKLSSNRPTARDNPSHPDTSETVHISSLALLKMLRHARLGVPMEVMGLMLGEFVDDYTINIVDVFAMPQSGTGVAVEAIDPVYEAKMLDILKTTSRTEMVVGWYHSHPGFGCWLSSVDISTQQNFEALSPRAVAVVVDPIQSVRGKVVIDAFRSIPRMNLGGVKLAPTAEARQTTSNLGHLVRPSIVAAVHGLGFRYYSLPIAFCLGSKEAKMLQCLNKQNWAVGLHTSIYKGHNKKNENLASELKKMTKLFTKDIAVKQNFTKKEIELQKVGKLDPKRRMEDLSKDLLQRNIVQTLCGVGNTKVFR